MPQDIATLEQRLSAAESVQEHVDALNALAWACFRIKPQQALNYSQQAYQRISAEDFEEQPYRQGLVASLRNQGAAHLRLSQLERAQSLLSEALMLNVEIADAAEHALIFTLLGTIDRRLGNNPVAVDRLLTAISKAESENQVQAQALAHHELSLLYVDNEPKDRAIATLERSLELFRSIQDRQGEADALCSGSYIAHRLGDDERAYQMGERALKLYRELEDGYGEASALIQLGQTCDPFDEAARHHYNNAYKLTVDTGQPELEVQVLIEIAQWYLRREEADSALERLQAAQVRIAAVEEMAWLHQHLHLVLSQAYKQAKQYEDALHHHEMYTQYEQQVVGERARVRMENLYFVHQVEATREETELYKLQSEALEHEIALRKEAQMIQQESYNQLAVLYRVSDEMSEIENIQLVLTISLDAAARLSQGEAGFIALMDAEKEEMRVATFIGDYPPRLSNLLLKPDEGPIGRAMVDQEPLRILDVSQEPDYTPLRENTKALMIVPLLSRWRLVGILVMETAKPERFSEKVFHFLIILASRIQVAVDNADLYRQVNGQLEEMKKLYNQVSQLEQMKTDMIRIAAHDLRGPLGIIQGYVQLMQLDVEKLPADFADYFGAMERTVKRMKNMLDDILSLERIEQMASDDNYVKIDLTQQIQKAYEEYRASADAKSQQYILLNEVFGDALIMGDTAQLYEAITNLVSNAIKYTPPQGKITIFLQADDDYVTFKVMDTGYGIPDDMQEKLFQPFYRATTHETADITGTGLGLHLVKKIIERHNGRMIFQSIYGEGSTFGFIMPRHYSGVMNAD